MMNITTLCQVALAKILLKGHTCLEAFTHFALQLHEEDGVWTLAFSATDGGYDRLFIDIKNFSSEAEAAAWLANGRVSTRVLNKAIAEHHLVLEEAQAFSEALKEAGEEEFLRHDHTSTSVFIDGVPAVRREWDWNAIEARAPFFENMLDNELEDGDLRVDTLAEVRRLRKLLDKYTTKRDRLAAIALV